MSQSLKYFWCKISSEMFIIFQHVMLILLQRIWYFDGIWLCHHIILVAIRLCCILADWSVSSCVYISRQICMAKIYEFFISNEQIGIGKTFVRPFSPVRQNKHVTISKVCFKKCRVQHGYKHMFFRPPCVFVSSVLTTFQRFILLHFLPCLNITLSKTFKI